MEYTTFGGTGMTVSKLCLGCMSFGRGARSEWALDEAGGRELLERAIDLGFTFFDTANVYSYGESEAILGGVLNEHGRDRFVVATKVFGQMDESDHNSGGLSRKTIEQELDASLDRLGMDAVDLYQIHRWDYDTSIDVTLRTLDDAVRRGKVRHLGASSMWAHQLADALHASDRLGFDRFVSMQNHYNLLYREEEREMLPLCTNEGIAVMPWSPLARGYLTRPHRAQEATARGVSDERAKGHPYFEGGGRAVNERVEELAADKGVSMAQLALSWVLHKEWVTTPVIGASSVEHLEAAVEALDVSLSSSDVEWLEEPYQPVRVSGHQ